MKNQVYNMQCLVCMFRSDFPDLRFLPSLVLAELHSWNTRDGFLGSSDKISLLLLVIFVELEELFTCPCQEKQSWLFQLYFHGWSKWPIPVERAAAAVGPPRPGVGVSTERCLWPKDGVTCYLGHLGTNFSIHSRLEQHRVNMGKCFFDSSDSLQFIRINVRCSVPVVTDLRLSKLGGDWQHHHHSRKRKKWFHDDSRWPNRHDENHSGTCQEWVW